MHAPTLLRRVRTESGLTLRQLAAVAHTSHSTLAAYESGRKTPTVATLDRIVGAAGFALDASIHRRRRVERALSRGDELAAVLDLAEQFPARHSATLDAPVFGRTNQTT